MCGGCSVVVVMVVVASWPCIVFLSAFACAQLYPAGATTNSDSGVTDISNCKQALAAMAEVWCFVSGSARVGASDNTHTHTHTDTQTHTRVCLGCICLDARRLVCLSSFMAR